MKHPIHILIALAASLTIAGPAVGQGGMGFQAERISQPAERDQHIEHVDVLVVNQYNRRVTCQDGSSRCDIVWYDSYWRVHRFPWGPCGVAVWQHCGWAPHRPILRCGRGRGDGGRAYLTDVMSNGAEVTITAAEVWYVVSDFDFEYRNRRFQWGPLVVVR